MSRRFADFLLFDLNRFAVFDLLFELIYNVSMATTAVFLPKKRVFGPVRVDLRLVLGLDELNAGVVVLITANKSRGVSRLGSGMRSEVNIDLIAL